MTSKLMATMLVAALATIVAVPAFATSFASWQSVSDSNISTGNGMTTFTINAGDTIPIKTNVLGGFGWFYADGPNTVFAVTTHNGVQDSVQNPNGWHVHNVQLTGETPVSATACIGSVSDVTTAGISIHGNTLNVNVPNTKLTGSLKQGAVAFSIVGDGGCGSGLGVLVNTS
ncbi:MAG: hypothetical protein KGI10_06475 [Thaumarchaeota archaeon]|nr:hypothetical protein [Nitrososphaerota archaeon]